MSQSIVVGARLRRAFALGLIVVLAASVLRFSVREGAEAADTISPAFVDQLVAGGLVLPTTMTRLPDGRVLITEKSGRVRVLKNGQLLATPFLDFSGVVNEAFDRGLLGIAVGPDFTTTGYVYLTFVHDYDGSDSSNPTTSRLVRVTATGDVMQPNSQVVILGTDTGAGCASQTSPTCLDESYPSHTIDQVTVAPDGTLWVSLGDSANFDNPDQGSLRSQNLDSYRGKLLHLAANGDGLSSNPFYAGSVTTVRSKVYAYGFRNPFRFSFNPADNTIYVGDVGWANQEEVNVVTPGANFGWPCYEGAVRQATWQADPYCQNMYATGVAVKAPLLTYPHNGVGASVVMGDFTPTSTTFPTAYRNGFFYADYAQDWIRFQPVTATNTLNGASVEVATGLGGPVDFQFFPDGNLYFLTILTGQIRRLAPVTGGGTTQYLSDLATVGSPINGFGPFERDRSNGEGAAGDGNALKIAGVTFSKGLGMHAVADVSFAVPSGCTAFLASVGVDDEVGTDPGDVVFEVWNGTSTRLYQSALTAVGQAATAVNVAVSGVATLRLVVTAGGDNNWFDHADWGNARFSCSGGGGDVTAPSITGVGSAVTASSATISWTTDEGSSSQVEWGTPIGYGNSTVFDSALVTTHGQSIGGLLVGTMYHYRVRSVDATGNEGVSGDNVFMTSGSIGGATRYLSDLPTTGTPVNGYGPFERDRSNGEGAAGDGNALKIAGVTFSKGLGMHAVADVSFAVPSGCTAFLASVGVDDEVGTDPGDVVFEVWNGTSTRLYQSALTAVGQAATAVNVSVSGVATLRLVVTAGGDNNWFDHADWGNARFTCSGGTGNAAPVPVISAPTALSKYKVGDTIAFTGTATDAEDGPLATSKLTWNVLLKHCPGGVCHVHPYLSYTGAGSSFVVPDHGDDSYFEIALSATDSQGLAGSTTLRIDPSTVQVTLLTSPSGLQLIYSDTTVTTPVSLATVVGSQHVLQAITPQANATFASWSDGGAQQHTITVGASAATYTATYTTTGGGSTQFLSDLATVGTPVNGYGPFERDKSNGESAAGDGAALKVAGVTFAKGLGVHAVSDLSFAVPSGCSAFDASVGIDDEVGADPGDVVFELWNGTTTRLYQSALKPVGQAATAVSVPMSGVSTLRLVVTAGGDNNWFDHADWGNARFTCGSAPPDTTPPVISVVGATVTSSAATVNWTTNEPSTTQVDYGLTTGYGTTTPLVSTLLAGHSQVLSGLAASTLYNYRVRSTDASGNPSTSTNFTFTTSSGGTGPVFGSPTSYATGNHPHASVIADFNGDGIRDVAVVTAGSNAVTVRLGTGGGALGAATSFAVGDQPKSVATGDFNGDGKIDLVTANQGNGTNNVSVLLGTGTGSFGAATSFQAAPNSHEAAVGDLNGDGKADLAVVGWGGNVLSILFGNGNGTFAAKVDITVGTAPHSVVIVDLNGDGKMDIATANHDSASISVLIGSGTGTFAEKVDYAVGGGPHSIRAGDLTGDGRPELVVANDSSSSITVLRNSGTGTFATTTDYATTSTPKSVAVVDVNGDGKLDVLVSSIAGNYPTVVNPGADRVALFLGTGTGTLGARTDYVAGTGSFSVVIGDLNGDGRPDMIVTNWHDDTMQVRLNQS